MTIERNVFFSKHAAVYFLPPLFGICAKKWKSFFSLFPYLYLFYIPPPFAVYFIFLQEVIVIYKRNCKLTIGLQRAIIFSWKCFYKIARYHVNVNILYAVYRFNTFSSAMFYPRPFLFFKISNDASNIKSTY